MLSCLPWQSVTRGADSVSCRILCLNGNSNVCIRASSSEPQDGPVNAQPQVLVVQAANDRCSIGADRLKW